MPLWPGGWPALSCQPTSPLTGESSSPPPRGQTGVANTGCGTSQLQLGVEAAPADEGRPTCRRREPGLTEASRGDGTTGGGGAATQGAPTPERRVEDLPQVFVQR